MRIRTTDAVLLLAVLLGPQSTLAYSSSKRWHARNVCSRTQQTTQLRISTQTQSPTGRRRRRACDPCNVDVEQETDSSSSSSLLLDRREAAFALLGALWATTTSPLAAHALSGDAANLALPNVLQGMSDRLSKQCLVESLGNRECLVYQEDADKLLYKGADTRVLLERMERAAVVLTTQLPPLLEQKKWSQVLGVLTGPLGELIKTMQAIAKLQDDPTLLSERQVQVVKRDLYAITAAVDKKDVSKALAAYELTANDLAVFIKGLR